MATISFKNVGVKEFEPQNVLTTPQSLTPIGIKTPVAFGQDGEGVFAMYTDIKDVIHDNLRNLILTDHGERMALYDFGANLHPLVAEYTSKQNFDPEAMLRINTTVAKYMPFVTLVGFDSHPEFINNEATARIIIFILYSVPQVGIVERGLELILSVI